MFEWIKSLFGCSAAQIQAEKERRARIAESDARIARLQADLARAMGAWQRSAEDLIAHSRKDPTLQPKTVGMIFNQQKTSTGYLN